MSVVGEETAATAPQLLHLDYSPILYIDGNETVYQNITADVFSSGGNGELAIRVAGQDKNVAETVSGDVKEDSVYEYRWSVPFDASNVGK